MAAQLPPQSSTGLCGWRARRVGVVLTLARNPSRLTCSSAKLASRLPGACTDLAGFFQSLPADTGQARLSHNEDWVPRLSVVGWGFKLRSDSGASSVRESKLSAKGQFEQRTVRQVPTVEGWTVDCQLRKQHRQIQHRVARNTSLGAAPVAKQC